MMFGPQFVSDTIAAFTERCDAARLAGGIPLMDVKSGKRSVPAGWYLDFETYYYLPLGVSLDVGHA